MLTQLLTVGGDDEATEGFVMFVMNRLNTFLSNLLSCQKVQKKTNQPHGHREIRVGD